jgi:peptidoglycan/xylan/chitin deacetylase (PgdA/CDA1 family)
MVLFYHVPKSISKAFPELVFHGPRDKKTIYLTFDDGPHPEISTWVMDQLEKYNAKATFFCVGDNIIKYPKTFEEMLNRGHQVGNHTYNHLNGWKTPQKQYLKNTLKAQHLYDFKLFRPPYGKIKPQQIKQLKKTHNIVLWDVLSGDFNKSLSSEQCFSHVKKHTQPGSIIVFHDSLKAEKHLKAVLPQTLEYFHALGFTFDSLAPLEK